MREAEGVPVCSPGRALQGYRARDGDRTAAFPSRTFSGLESNRWRDEDPDRRGPGGVHHPPDGSGRSGRRDQGRRSPLLRRRRRSRYHDARNTLGRHRPRVANEGQRQPRDLDVPGSSRRGGREGQDCRAARRGHHHRPLHRGRYHSDPARDLCRHHSPGHHGAGLPGCCRDRHRYYDRRGYPRHHQASGR